jgi:hypothetical protein
VPLTGGQGQSVISAGPGIPLGVPVQAVAATAASLTTLAATLAPTTAGNCLAVCFGSGSSASNPQVTGITLGGSADNWQAAATAYANADVNAAIWIDPDCAGGQSAVVITCAGSGSQPGLACWVFEIPGVTASPLDAHPAGVNGASSPWSSASTGPLAQAGEIAIGCAACFGSVNALTGPAAPWTGEAVQRVTGTVSLIAGYQLTPSAAALAYAGTLTGTDAIRYGTCIATLKGAAVSPGALPAGEGIVTVGPQALGTIWYPTQVTISTSSGVSDNSEFNVYMGPNGVPNVLVGTLFPGGSGTVPLAVPSMSPGQYLIGIWTGGKAGDVCSMNVLGTMDALTTG